MRGRVGFQLVDDADVQAPEFAHHLAQVVALLPAVQAVGGSVLARCFGLLRGAGITQLALEGGQHRRNVIVELGARQGVALGQCRVAADRLAPGLHDCRPTLCQVSCEIGQFGV